jgi:hypothetical protein
MKVECEILKKEKRKKKERERSMQEQNRVGTQNEKNRTWKKVKVTCFGEL